MLHFSPKDIDRAVLFATNNALVCETPEDANKVAYEMDKKTRYDVSIYALALFKQSNDNVNYNLCNISSASH